MAEAMHGTPRRFLAPEVLARLQNLELAARTAVEGALIGGHRSALLGFSQEFAEYRAYEPGDDLRFVDWNVYARADRLCVKRFFGDTNTQVLVLLDVSGSMGFGSGGLPKLDYARLIAAALFYLGSRQHDAVGLLAFDARVRAFVAPSSRAPRVRGLYHELDRLEAGSTTSVELPFAFLRERLPRRSIVVLVSDFWMDPRPLRRTLQPLARRGHDLLLVHLLDPAERSPDLAGTPRVRDLETGGRLDVDVADLKEEYPKRLALHLAEIRRIAGELRAGYVPVNTHEPLDRTLFEYLRFRRRRA